MFKHTFLFSYNFSIFGFTVSIFFKPKAHLSFKIDVPRVCYRFETDLVRLAVNTQRPNGRYCMSFGANECTFPWIIRFSPPTGTPTKRNAAPILFCCLGAIVRFFEFSTHSLRRLSADENAVRGEYWTLTFAPLHNKKVDNWSNKQI